MSSTPRSGLELTAMDAHHLGAVAVTVGASVGCSKPDVGVDQQHPASSSAGGSPGRSLGAQLSGITPGPRRVTGVPRADEIFQGVDLAAGAQSSGEQLGGQLIHAHAPPGRFDGQAVSQVFAQMHDRRHPYQRRARRRAQPSF